MLYVLITIVLLLVAVTVLRVRARLVLDRGQRTFFVGLGRSGREQDLLAGTGRLKLFGINVATLGPAKREKAKPKEKPVAKPKKKKTPRKRSAYDFVRLIPDLFRAVTGYFISLVRSIEVEQLEGEIEAGFDSPDITGQVYGYYTAAMATVPAVAGRFKFTPDFSGPSFDGSARVSLAIPLYRILLRTAALLIDLPLRKIIKLAIGRKKGDQDVQ